MISLADIDDDDRIDDGIIGWSRAMRDVVAATMERGS